MRRGLRFAILAVFLAIGGLLYTYLSGQVTETEIAFVLTDLEVSAAGHVLRHEDVERLDCRIALPSSGKTLATIQHRRPGAVTNTTSVRLPPGEYDLHITLTFKLPSGAPHETASVVRARLEGKHVDLRP